MSSTVDLQVVQEAIPVAARRKIYAGYGLLVIAGSAVQIGFASVQAPQPTALTVVLAVLLFLGGPVAIIARVNATPAADVVPVPERALDADGDGKPDYSDEETR